MIRKILKKAFNKVVAPKTPVISMSHAFKSRAMRSHFCIVSGCFSKVLAEPTGPSTAKGSLRCAFGQRGGHQYLLKDLPSRAVEGSSHLKEGLIRCADAGKSVQQNREDRYEKDDRDLGRYANAENQNEERDQRHKGTRIEERDPRIERILHSTIGGHRKAERDSQHGSKTEADREFERAHGDVPCEVAREEQRPAGGELV